MERSARKNRGFSFAEMLIVLVAIGVIAMFAIPQLLLGNFSGNGNEAKAKKMNGYLAQASLEILLYDSGLDDYTNLKDREGYFSVESGDASDITRRMSRLFLKYLLDVDSIPELNEYFNADIKEFSGASIGSKLNDLYSNFFFANDGMIVGFKFYGNCTTTEPNFIPPEFKTRTSVENACGSIFYDINAYSKPNRLGQDQFIIPVGKRGIKYENDN